jgi:predicted RecB family nuclease
MKINNAIFLNYLLCPYKAGLLLSHQSASPTDYQVLAEDLARRYEPLARDAISRLSPDVVLSPDRASIASLLREGPSLILDATIEVGDFEFHFDALKRCSSQRSSAEPQYMPVLFHHGNTVPASQQLLLTFGGYVLHLLRDDYPSTGIVVHGTQCLVRSVYLTPKYRKVELIATALTAKRQVPLILNKNCGNCEFQSRCFAEAKKQDNLTLLNGMTEKSVRQYARKGIFTVTQLSYTFHPRRQSKRAKARGRPHSFALQALAIRDQKIYIFAPAELPPAETRVFIDMEGTPGGSFIYLIGLLIQQGEREQSYSFWADTQEDEAKIFELLAHTVSQLPSARVFHYGPYETRALKRIPSCIPPPSRKCLIGTAYTNVLSALYAKVYFPVYSNRLKDVAGCLGYVWQDPTPSGLQAVVWRHRWEQTHDCDVKAALVRYNLDDCHALKLLTTFLYEIGSQPRLAPSTGSQPDVVAVESLADPTEQCKGAWGKKTFAVAAFEAITKHAYFEYQRAKVFLRTNLAFREIHKRQKRRQKRPAVRASKVVDCRARTCPFCGSRELHLNENRGHTKLSLDLRISSVGIARVAKRYRCHWYKCLRCAKCFLPRAYTDKERFGHNLASWAIHQHVANRITFENLATTARECFSLPIDFRQLYEFKDRLARYYSITYKKLMEKLVCGPLLHADETTMNLQKGKCYVWVLTNMEEVVFIWRPDRNASFLHELLREFHGVLVTDFFTGYDSLKCSQQKCLVHLIRDLNDALLADPFDEGLKALGTTFGELLRSITVTVDRFGLKRKYLKRHKGEVASFFGEVANRVFESEAARTLHKRMLKYRHQLFTFLDYDGIPWNNNNAEHAIKHFAKYRRLVNGRVRTVGLKNYLELLSLYETCRYKEIGFLGFLVSKRRDIDLFATLNGCGLPRLLS